MHLNYNRIYAIKSENNRFILLTTKWFHEYVSLTSLIMSNNSKF